MCESNSVSWTSRNNISLRAELLNIDKTLTKDRIYTFCHENKALRSWSKYLIKIAMKNEYIKKKRIRICNILADHTVLCYVGFEPTNLGQ